MKFAFIGFVTVVVVGCSGEDGSTYLTTPTPAVTAAPAPTPTPRELTSIRVIVTEGNEPCIRGATVEIVAGEGLGKSVTHGPECTSIWDEASYLHLQGLIVGATVTLRASAEGYSPREVIVRPGFGPGQIEIILSRLP